MKSNFIQFAKWTAVFILMLIIWMAVDKSIQLYLPFQYNPLKPLSIDDETSFLTQHKINRLKSDKQACLSVLEKSDLKFQSLPDQKTGESCGLYDTVLLEQSEISYGGGITLKCPALVSLVIWELHDLQPLAVKILQQKVVRIKHYGTYACRNVNNSKKARRSQHAYANAIDVAGFILQDGSEISVLKDWEKATEAGQFLSAIHQSACQYFSTVLGPDYNAAHKSHFHFGHGPSSICH